jgi:DNA (cytosine-5)-methyltransferase 1
MTRKNHVTKFDFIDLFAGIGGFRLAFEEAGGKCLFASEWDKYAAQTYEENFGHLPSGDITKIPTTEIPLHDILTAGFPCQPFSIAGVSKHNALGNEHGFRHATQGTLFFEVARIIESRQPKAFVLENVKNLLSHDNKRTFKVIEKTLKEELGYNIHVQVIDAKRVVPQHRERVYIVGFRQDVDDSSFQFPVFKKKPKTLREILDTDVSSKYTLTDHLWNYLINYAEKHRAKGNGFGCTVVDLDGTTRTLSARYYKDGSEILIPQEGRNPRRLTPKECAKLMGFPDDFKIPVSDTQAYRQFGNSVVVPVVTGIAQNMASCLLKETNRHLISKSKQQSVLPFGHITDFAEGVTA